MLCALIMAGGKGERFWPLSTDEKPKQFLKLLGEETMIQMTVNRLRPLIPIERIFIVTAKSYLDLVREQLPDLPVQNIISEPVGRNTAPCIALSAFIIENIYKDSTIMVLPSDHLIVDNNKFREVLNSAANYIDRNEDAIITIGMKPTRPDTGYGYIKYGEINDSINGNQIRSVEKFVEKPNLEKAEEYLQQGCYLWNGGMFIWKSKTILRLTKNYLKDTYLILSEIASTSEEKFEDILERKYALVESVSVDYGIMEKAENIHVIPSDFGWDDVGSWYSVERVREKDNNNNVVQGDSIKINSTNNIIFANNKPIVVAGVNDLFVVDTGEIIFIGNKNVIDNIKEIKQSYLKS